MYCPTEDLLCPYYNKHNGICELGCKAINECDDAYAAFGDDCEESYTYEEPFAVYDPEPN